MDKDEGKEGQAESGCGSVSGRVFAGSHGLVRLLLSFPCY